MTGLYIFVGVIAIIGIIVWVTDTRTIRALSKPTGYRVRVMEVTHEASEHIIGQGGAVKQYRFADVHVAFPANTGLAGNGQDVFYTLPNGVTLILKHQPEQMGDQVSSLSLVNDGEAMSAT